VAPSTSLTIRLLALSTIMLGSSVAHAQPFPWNAEEAASSDGLVEEGGKEVVLDDTPLVEDTSEVEITLSTPDRKIERPSSGFFSWFGSSDKEPAEEPKDVAETAEEPVAEEAKEVAQETPQPAEPVVEQAQAVETEQTEDDP